MEIVDMSKHDKEKHQPIKLQRQNALDEILAYAEAQQTELALAQEHTNMLREVLNTLSHDLKTLLSVINTNVYLLDRKTSPDQKQRLLGQIRTQSQYLERLIKDILTISRLDVMPCFSLSPVKLDSVANTIVNQFQVIAEAHALRLELEVDKNLPAVMANEIELHRALSNLVENALYYTPSTGTVNIRMTSDVTSVLIDVRDTGIGIAEADLPYIFTPFYRASNAREADSHGTGLGLAIVKKTIELHGGSIEVRSHIGKGTVFRVRLPIAAIPTSVA